MIRGCGRLIYETKVLCSLPLQLPGAAISSCRFSVRRPCTTEELRDFGLPNATWSQNLKDLYNKFLELSKNGSWKRIPSHNTIAHHLQGDPHETRIGKRMFLRNLDSDGLGFEYCMFFNRDERRMVCLFQPGPYLEGPPGPIPLGCTLFVDSHVNKIEGRKVYSSCHIQSHDGVILHAEATALFIKANQ
ncbi:acyl-coenzyme A thioesterase THEM4-like isoform X2 [Dendropsophus ebraccatus]|uniref:acyl-coenzyme A thioesterase THEM4-like isoform X2 n=1 Tax=Dendropsophus ebraccatus TaxID=150705 RepID=UPI003831B38B